MSLDLLPIDIDPDLAAGVTQPWTGRYPVPTGLFEIRPPRLPRDALPVFDVDLDCIIGYQRAFAHRCRLFDLSCDMLGAWEAMTALPPPEKRNAVIGGGRTMEAQYAGQDALGLNGSGMAPAPAMLAQLQLRTRFAGLAERPPLYTEAAHACMKDPQRFIPVHILPLAMPHGDRVAPPGGLKGVSRYMIRLRIRRLPFMLDLVSAQANMTIVGFEYWRYADSLPATGSDG